MTRKQNIGLEEEKTFELKIENRVIRTIDHPFIIKILDEFEIEDYEC
jgi:ribosomal protein L28